MYCLSMDCEAINCQCATSGGEISRVRRKNGVSGFGRRLEFQGSQGNHGCGLLTVGESGKGMELTEMVADLIEDKRTGKNIQHHLTGIFRQPVSICSLNEAIHSFLFAIHSFPSQVRT